MDYFEVEINIAPYSVEISEILVAELGELGFESFVDTETGIQAYIPARLFEKTMLSKVFAPLRFENTVFSFSEKLIPAQNWNALWESNFEPIYISNKILVRAPFHNITEKYDYEIVIEPKMSFGTGHHETTSLVMEQMLNIDFQQNTVLDMGCGTGILAILASMLGASDIVAIDFDDWAYQNTIENFQRNNCEHILALCGDALAIPSKKFDTILANINRNVLLNDISKYTSVLKSNGILVLSGFYIDDVHLIEKEANRNNLTLQKVNSKNNWAVCIFIKQ
jgi:ribosomal protein L11 methyltransferase